MSRLYLVSEGAEIARRRGGLPPTALVEAWPDLLAPGEFWLGETSKALLDQPGNPLPTRFAIDGERVPVYYGPRLCDVESLPSEESLRSRVLSARGIALAWITLDRFGERAHQAPASLHDPVFYLRRPGGSAAHLWRLFRTRREAGVYLSEHFAGDPEIEAWVSALPVEDFDELLERHAIPTS